MKLIFTALIILIALCTFGQKTLHIYGGKDHDVYLGCLNFDNYNTQSIWNSFGTYGSKYNAISIWNSNGNYGSNYSSISPFNSYASDPPVIVDKDGGFYGYFTTNSFKNKRADFSSQ